MRPEDIDFLIIGAAKSATTWLQKSLQADPAVSMPDPELHYFSRNFERGTDWYLQQFPDPENRLVGEKSNSYLDDPVAPPRVHALLPHVRLIVQLRNPVERAYSDYCMLYRRGEVGRDIEAHLDTVRGADKRFLMGGLYHEQLTTYLDRYPAERIQVLFYEDMLREPDAQLRRARDFLGLPPAAAPLARREKVKDRTEAMIGPGLRRWMKPLKPLVRPFRGHPAFQAARGALAGEIRYPPLSPKLRARLVDFYAPDVDRLGALVRRDLSGWLGGSGAHTSLE